MCVGSMGSMFWRSATRDAVIRSGSVCFVPPCTTRCPMATGWNHAWRSISSRARRSASSKFAAVLDGAGSSRPMRPMIAVARRGNASSNANNVTFRLDDPLLTARIDGDVCGDISVSGEQDISSRSSCDVYSSSIAR